MTPKRAAVSLSLRLLAVAGLTITLALAGAGVVIDGILQRFVNAQIDERLDVQILALAAAVEVDRDGAPSLKRNLDLPPYERALSGWYWQVTATDGVLTSRSLAGSRLDGAIGPAGEPLHLRTRTIVLPDEGGPVVLAAAAPSSAILAPLSAARSVLVFVLLALGLSLACALVLQVRYGLKPLRRLEQDLRRVRAGDQAQLPDAQPSEVRPIVNELNAVLLQNRSQLDLARTHIANLAHGLRTPLATLAASLGQESSAATLGHLRLIEDMDRRIAHHLRRSRTAALQGGRYRSFPLAARVDDLIAAVSRIHVDRGIAVSVDAPLGLTLRCDPQDFDEMMGNLLDNAFKWGRSAVRVEARPVGSSISITIDDDGPGIAPDSIDRALKRGERIDETTPGTGFGLPITFEITALYGGKLDLERSSIGGLRAKLTLPAN